MEAETFLLNIETLILPIKFHSLTLGISAAIFATFLLLILSAMISGSEVAYFSLSPKELKDIQEEKNKVNKLTLKHLDDPELLLATILIANNFANVGIVILSSFVTGQIIDFNNHHLFAILFDIVFITSLLLFFGEILPKVYATQAARYFANTMAYPLLIMKKLLKPASLLLVKSTSIVNKRISKHSSSAISLDDLSQALELTSDAMTEDKEILEGIVKFGNINVGEIMTSRVDVTDLDIKSDFNKVLAVIVESGYSRIPVFEETPDNVKGVLYVKDLLPYINKEADFEWQQLIRDTYYVPENKKINDLLSEFKDKKIHMAIVVDEYGGTSGIITLEDVLEEIVGEINDELDSEEEFYSIQPDGSYIFEAKTLLNDFYKITNCDEVIFDAVKGDAETLAGLILELKGEIPKKHETIEFHNITFTILAADQRRIKKIQISFIAEAPSN